MLTVAFSPDGKILASGGEDNLIKIWDVASGTESQTLSGHSNIVNKVAFSPNSSILASSSYDKTVKVWDVSHGRIIQNLTGHTGWASSVVFSPDGMVLVSGDNIGTIRIWNTTNWEGGVKMKREHKGWVNYVAFSPDGTLMATCGLDKVIKIWNTTSWEVNQILTGHTDVINEVKFSPDGKMLVSACIDSSFWIWNMTSGNVTYEYDEHTDLNLEVWDFFSSVDYSPTSSMMASGGEDRLIRLWDAAKNETIHTLSGHEDYVSRVLFSPDGTLLASCSKDTTIKLWNVIRGAELLTLPRHRSAVTSVDFSPSGTLLVSGSEDNTVKLWNVTDETEPQLTEPLTLTGHEDVVTFVTFSPDSSLLASASWDSNVKLWNMTNFQLESELTNHTGFVYSLAFSSDGTMLASGSGTLIFQPEIRIWNTTSGEELRDPLDIPPGIHTSPVTSIAFSRDGTFLASGSEDGSVIVWNVSNWTPLHTLLDWHKGGAVKSMAFSPINTLFASSGEDNYIRLINVTNGESIYNLTKHSSSVLSVNFSPDGKLLVSGSADGTIRLWNISNGNEQQIYYLYKVNVNSVAFSPTGKMIASGGSDSTIKLWGVDINPDFDTDGMSDKWELEFSPELDPSDYWDKFDDEDEDMLMNSLEYFLGLNPLDNDSDDDNMLDGWEYLGGLKPMIDDALYDSDDDGMDNLYEYETGLNPRVNDAAGDKDGDGLTNLQEFLFGSWANQIDSDLDEMPDWWEYKYTDSTYSFNPRNKSDTKDDPDGDWVNNLDEYRGKTNPRDFWSVPLFAPSAFFFIKVMILLIMVGLAITIFLNFKNKQRKAFITSLKASDYITALKIQKAGYSDYPAFLKAEEDAKTLIEMGNNLFFQGEYRKAIQQYEQALTVFKRTENDPMVASIVFRVARIQKERQELTADSVILKLIPQSPFAEPVIKAFDHMTQALVAEAKDNWGTAKESWQAALSYEGLDIEFKIICQGAIIEFKVRNWLDNPTDATRESLFTLLDEWKELSKINRQFGSLCRAYLLSARVALASFQFEEMEENLDLCAKIAEKEELKVYQELVSKETKIFLKHKKRLSSLLETEKPVSPDEQIKLLQDYIKTALASLEKEELKKD